MLKISDAVYEILSTSEVPLEAFRQGILNLSAYADQIHARVEELTWKKVKRGTIIVALARLGQKLDVVPSLTPSVQLNELSIKSPLCDISFEKTKTNCEKARTLSEKLSENDSHFLTITQGITEITVVASADQRQFILDHFEVQPKSEYRDLVGITVTFSDEYMPEPNVIYTILSALAAKRINLLEIISTYTALTMIIRKEEMEIAVAQLNKLFRPLK